MLTKEVLREAEKILTSVITRIMLQEKEEYVCSGTKYTTGSLSMVVKAIENIRNEGELIGHRTYNPDEVLWYVESIAKYKKDFTKQ